MVLRRSAGFHTGISPSSGIFIVSILTALDMLVVPVCLIAGLETGVQESGNKLPFIMISPAV